MSYANNEPPVVPHTNCLPKGDQQVEVALGIVTKVSFVVCRKSLHSFLLVTTASKSGYFSGLGCKESISASSCCLCTGTASPAYLIYN